MKRLLNYFSLLCILFNIFILSSCQPVELDHVFNYFYRVERKTNILVDGKITCCIGFYPEFFDRYLFNYNKFIINIKISNSGEQVLVDSYEIDPDDYVIEDFIVSKNKNQRVDAYKVKCDIDISKYQFSKVLIIHIVGVRDLNSKPVEGKISCIYEAETFLYGSNNNGIVYLDDSQIKNSGNCIIEYV